MGTKIVALDKELYTPSSGTSVVPDHFGVNHHSIKREEETKKSWTSSNCIVT